MINESFPVTFGVELEAILAFHESLLRQHLHNTGSAAEIIKDIPQDVRTELRQVTTQNMLTRPEYMSWALTTPTAYDMNSPDHQLQEFHDRHLAKHGYRGYAGEILTLAKTFLPQSVEVHDSWMQKYANFAKWHITQDRSLVGVPKDELRRQLVTDGDLRTGEERDWDSFGIELVSRVLAFEPGSFDEIARHLMSFRGGLAYKYKAFASGYCGMHVHVGIPLPDDHPEGVPQPTFSLALLMHVAYILVMYERPIAKIFPESRREGSDLSTTDLQTNLDNFFPEPEYDPNEPFEEFEPAQEAGEDEAALVARDMAAMNIFEPLPYNVNVVSPVECPTVPFGKARAMIFAPDMTVAKLAKLMGGTIKSRVVNWTYVSRTDGTARTLEFRQHEGTLDLESIKWWTTFVVGLIRLAEYNSRVSGVGKMGEDGKWEKYDGEGYRWKELDESVDVEDLMEMMDLPQEGRNHFRRRVQMWA